MLKKERSKKSIKMKYVLAVPVFLLLFFAFSCNKSNEIQVTKDENQNITVKKENLVNISESSDKLNTENIEDVNFLVVEKHPEFPGGLPALRQYIAENLNYPAEARENKIFGTVYLRFVVKKTGEVSKIELQRGVHELLDNEAIRVIKELPDFVPGEQSGKKVNVWFSMGIAFKLQ